MASGPDEVYSGRADDLPSRLLAVDCYPGHPVRVNSYSKPKYNIDILNALSGMPEMDLLLQSPLGALFSLPVRQCSLFGQLVHQLLCRQLYTDEPNATWFVFGGQPLRFSLMEFEEVTGLCCSEYPPPSEMKSVLSYPDGESPYWYKLIGGKLGSVTVKSLLLRLKSEPQMPRRRKFQIALVVLVEGVLLSESHTVRPSVEVVEMRLTKLKSFHSKNILAVEYDPLLTVSYPSAGPSSLLPTVFADPRISRLEALFSTGTRFTMSSWAGGDASFPPLPKPKKRVRDRTDTDPSCSKKKKKPPKKPVVDRRLRFGKSSLFAEVCSANPQLDDYPSSSSSTEHNESQPHNSPPSLHASPPSPDIHSSSKPHMSADGLSPPFVHQPSGLPPPQPFKSHSSQPPTPPLSETSLLGVASFGPAESPVKGSSTLESARFNTDAVASKASPSSDLVQHVTPNCSFVHQIPINSPLDKLPSNEEVLSMFSPKGLPLLPISPASLMCPPIPSHTMKLRSSSNPASRSSPIKPRKPKACQQKRLESQTPHSPTLVSSILHTNASETHLISYILNTLTPPTETKMSKFKTMLAKGKAREYFIDGQPIRTSFFIELQKPQQWLSTPHTDALVAFVWKKHQAFFHTNRITIVDSMFSSIMATSYPTFQKTSNPTKFLWHKLLLSYVKGAISGRNVPQLWLESVDTVYLPMNWGRKHWVALSVDLRRGHIAILDPISDCSSTRKVLSYMPPVAHLLPHLQRVSHFLESTG
ncbi:unnamed protein product [Arabidopsis thaliana]|uniref:Ubiquitin-like protease family profile domain-containing protein n=1 Tax=Arabidopsis thaliana TaxID=3702 RepID=A0A5S9WYZ9_ARATH|nr:unnamed protein product [Arabidopsis thaliana]